MDWFDCTGQDQEFLVANNPAFAEAIGTRRTSISNVIWESGVPIIAIFTPALHEMTGEVVVVVTLQSEVESFFRSNVHKKTHEPLAFVAIESGCGDLLTFQLENSMPTLIHSCRWKPRGRLWSLDLGIKPARSLLKLLIKYSKHSVKS